MLTGGYKMKYAADFRADARSALRNKWGLAVLTGLVATLLGGTGIEGPKFNLDIGNNSVTASFKFAGTTIYSFGGSSNSDTAAFIFYYRKSSLFYLEHTDSLPPVPAAGKYHSNRLRPLQPGADGSGDAFFWRSVLLLPHLEDCHHFPDSAVHLYLSLVAASGYTRHHRHLQLCHDPLYPGGASGAYRQRGNPAVQRDDVRTPMAPVLPAFQFYWMDASLHSDTGHRIPVARSLYAGC